MLLWFVLVPLLCRHECDYEIVAQLVEILTGVVQLLTISGSGSPDEQFSHT